MGGLIRIAITSGIAGRFFATLGGSLQIFLEADQEDFRASARPLPSQDDRDLKINAVIQESQIAA